jgi:putative ABC transport system permease protein
MSSVQTIPLGNLAFAFIPVIAVVVIIGYWGLGYATSLQAISRMLLQLAMIGYFLGFIFESDSALIVVAVLSVMLLASSWIALRTIRIPRRTVFMKSFGSISLSGGVTLLLITQGVLDLQPWYLPSYMIPLAGMIFASAMNSVSLAGERLGAELDRQVPYEKARSVALHASLIPIMNSLFAVGLVSIPGMMTGQILSGISPFVAARYQVMVMCMIFGSAGIASAMFLASVKSNFDVTGKSSSP